MTQTQTKSELILLEPIIEKYLIARTLDADEQRELYKEVKEIAEKDYKNAPVFNTYWEYNEQTGEINGSNIYRLILANKILARKSQRTLTFKEGMELDKRGKLTNGVYRDFGLVVCNLQQPNKEMAGSLVEQAEKRGWELPVLVHPLSLELSTKINNAILFSDDDSLIISGEEARDYIKQFDYKMDLEVRRLDRSGGGDWDAGWVGLAYSVVVGRVDWIRGEATMQNLESELLSQIDKVGKSELEALSKKIEKAKESVLKIMKS